AAAAAMWNSTATGASFDSSAFALGEVMTSRRAATSCAGRSSNLSSASSVAGSTKMTSSIVGSVPSSGCSWQASAPTAIAAHAIDSARMEVNRRGRTLRRWGATSLTMRNVTRKVPARLPPAAGGAGEDVQLTDDDVALHLHGGPSIRLRLQVPVVVGARGAGHVGGVVLVDHLAERLVEVHLGR